MLHIIGIDCAAQAKHIGLALGRHEGAHTRIIDVAARQGEAALLARLEAWIRAAPEVLLAIDAPLGWPAALGEQLAGHRAGEALAASAHDLFRRQTDAFIASTLKKQPLDVGANLIARAAHTALRLLEALRQRLDRPIPLAWAWPAAEAVSAIEVYPGAALTALGLKGVRYKGQRAGQGEALIEGRRRIVDCLEGQLQLGDVRPELIASDHVLDAALCVLAGEDFVLGRAMPPPEGVPVCKEGWIWSRPLPSPPAVAPPEVPANWRRR